MSLRASLTAVVCLVTTLAAQDARRTKPANPPAAPGGAAVRTAQQEVEHLLTAAKKSDAVAFWNWLPTDYQRDVEGLVRELATRVDAKTYDRSWQLMRRITKVAIDKQEFVFGTPTVAAFLQGNPEQQKKVRAAYGAICRLVQEVANSDLSTIEGLRSFDGRRFLAKSGKPMLDTMYSLARLQGQDPVRVLEQSTVKTLRQDGDEAQIELRAPGKAPEVTTFVMSGGRWLPQELVRDWQKNMDKMRAKIEAMPPAGDRQSAAQLGLVLGTVESYVRKFEEAETQAEFDEVCEEISALAGRKNPGQQKQRRR